MVGVEVFYFMLTLYVWWDLAKAQQAMGLKESPPAINLFQDVQMAPSDSIEGDVLGTLVYWRMVG